MTKVLILGNNPLPFEKTNYLSALGLRTWQLTKPLLDDGHEVCLVCLRVPQAFAVQELEPLIKKERPFLYYSLDFTTFTDPQIIHHIVEEFDPDCLVATNLLPCYQAARLKDKKPFWADLHGHAMAEAQAKAAVDKDDQFLYNYWNQERHVIDKGDVFSCVSTPQLYAVIGELGARGRLNQYTNGYNFVHVIFEAIPETPLAYNRAALRGTEVARDDFVVLWSGGYNTWADVDTLFRALEGAMKTNPKIKFLSTGGEIKGQDEVTYFHFLDLIRNSSCSANFIMKGWLPIEEARSYYLEADVGINIDQDIYEVRLGSKMRVMEWLWAGLPILSTRVCESIQILEREGVCFTFRPGDAAGLQDQIIWMANHREKVRQQGESGREFACHNLSYARTTEPLRAWVNNPYLAPDQGQRIGFEKERDSHISHLEDVLRDKDRLIHNKDPEIKQMKSVIGLRDKELEETRSRIRELEATLDRYHRTLPYRIYALLRRVRARRNP
ncbi:hypothetical protein HKBW3S42_00084 [Candidatus Hakubella thermalkaliphila]|uniref:Glycosyltransferase subfamily 4-like N-terminal domain-containing protein n=1 Tax=Candidatus Hakubella thermalkaliphila TaxID=2754717 RepID=A0A6V8PHT7_9ACTN|nr:hypothetical protein HKBW3S42_00084 [Candidatus Hakubella thermalkaliphila]